jgi:hypothetical protein
MLENRKKMQDGTNGKAVDAYFGLPSIPPRKLWTSGFGAFLHRELAQLAASGHGGDPSV